MPPILSPGIARLPEIALPFGLYLARHMFSRREDALNKRYATMISMGDTHNVYRSVGLLAVQLTPRSLPALAITLLHVVAVFSLSA